jgi:hypothetical protein
MRNTLPKAAFIGFTGTPLMAGEEKTKEVFGDYVSIYNFRQSIEDGATVPLFYENRIPELQLANENFKEDLEALIEEAELDDEQEKKLEREFVREYHLITRDGLTGKRELVSVAGEEIHCRRIAWRGDAGFSRPDFPWGGRYAYLDLGDRQQVFGWLVCSPGRPADSHAALPLAG